MIPILCLPSVKGVNLDATTMNWTGTSLIVYHLHLSHLDLFFILVVVWGGPLFIAAVFFGLHARKTYKGPKVCHPFCTNDNLWLVDNGTK